MVREMEKTDRKRRKQKEVGEERKKRERKEVRKRGRVN